MTFALVFSGCAAGEPPADGSDEAASSAALAPAPGGATTAPITPIPSLATLAKVPAWVKECGGFATRFSVLTRRCRPIVGERGTWKASTLFSSGGDTMCAMSWKGTGTPEYALLSAAALPETAAVPIGTPPPAIHAICDTAVCSPESATCAERSRRSPMTRPLGGMGGCSSCGFVVGDEAYVMLPNDWVDDTLVIEVGGAAVFVDPPGTQSFRVSLEGLTYTPPPAGGRFARIHHF
ncbi:MAG: hypothetical protein JST00_16660 [Deltaproteobacteria bacterium]|nr:hypothetical protein [Deltaproteobacteria bacterium]